MTFIKQSLVFNKEFKNNNIIPLIIQAIPFCVSTLKNTTEFHIIEKYYMNFVSELKNQIIQKFIIQIEEIKLLNENEISQIKDIISKSSIFEEIRELKKKI